MNSAIQFIVLLACITICTSASITKCHCVKTVEAVRPKLIAHVREHKPRPYCNEHEVIVILKDKSKLCLDPDSEFTKRVLETKNKSNKKTDKMDTVNPETTTAATTTSAASL
ncbi:alveolar macrophage chemotactic factor-like [Cyprinodon tularosa]|uniref:alveolar macrophage chemotactic factor-like n=1 Tax=Cyprinodon tularosa TaxID=77115 RepID=UPI0018E1DF9A|nr:alveolar macrophage chemotactic factor-like [Cyprinodon tularosa]